MDTVCHRQKTLGGLYGEVFAVCCLSSCALGDSGLNKPNLVRSRCLKKHFAGLFEVADDAVNLYVNRNFAMQRGRVSHHFRFKPVSVSTQNALPIHLRLGGKEPSSYVSQSFAIVMSEKPPK